MKYFLEASLLETNLLCHNLNVMHIEKTCLIIFFNTFIDVKGKTKDNIKARMNIALFYYLKNIELVYVESRVIKPKASFTLDNNA